VENPRHISRYGGLGAGDDKPFIAFPIDINEAMVRNRYMESDCGEHKIQRNDKEKINY
jgi:hypothetical protein